MWRTMTATALMMLPIGCADASSPTFESSDPVSCMVIFGIAANGAKQMSDAAAAEKTGNEMLRRTAFLAKQNGGIAWIKRITPQSMQIAAKMEAARDERATIKLFDECVARQNADPGFRSSMSNR